MAEANVQPLPWVHMDSNRGDRNMMSSLPSNSTSTAWDSMSNCKLPGGIGIDPVPVKPVLGETLRFQSLPDLRIAACTGQQHRQDVR
jgi:hypothetical protein